MHHVVVFSVRKCEIHRERIWQVWPEEVRFIINWPDNAPSEVYIMVLCCKNISTTHNIWIRMVLMLQTGAKPQFKHCCHVTAMTLGKLLCKHCLCKRWSYDFSTIIILWHQCLNFLDPLQLKNLCKAYHLNKNIHCYLQGSKSTQQDPFIHPTHSDCEA